jgi:hypothetical protein
MEVITMTQQELYNKGYWRGFWMEFFGCKDVFFNLLLIKLNLVPIKSRLYDDFGGSLIPYRKVFYKNILIFN